METGFLASTDCKLVFRLEETHFLTKPSISGIGGFSLYLIYLRVLSYLVFLLGKTASNMSGNPFLKTDLILASGNYFQEFLHPGL